jgi:probable F420-dependent oxidoreductase
MLRFGVTGWSIDGEGGWRDRLRSWEEAGFDTAWVPDHVGLMDPFSALAAAAQVAGRLELGTYVLNTGFWNPLLLARTIVTTDLLTGGRLVVGLGAGHNRDEHVQAGLPYPPAGERVSYLAALVPALRRLLAGETVDDERLGLVGAATGLPPVATPLLVGGNGDRVLDLAGREAERVGLVGFTSGIGRVHTDLSHWGWEGLADRLGRARAAAEGRALPADVLVQRAVVTDEPAEALADFAEAGLTGDRFDSPFLLVGDEDTVLGRLRRLDDLGIGGVTVFAHDADGFAPVIARYRAGAG